MGCDVNVICFIMPQINMLFDLCVFHKGWSWLHCFHSRLMSFISPNQLGDFAVINLYDNLYFAGVVETSIGTVIIHGMFILLHGVYCAFVRFCKCVCCFILVPNRFGVIYAFADQWCSTYIFSRLPMQSLYNNPEQMSHGNIRAVSKKKC